MKNPLAKSSKSLQAAVRICPECDHRCGLSDPWPHCRERPPGPRVTDPNHPVNDGSWARFIHAYSRIYPASKQPQRSA